MRSKTKRRIAALATSTVLCVAGLGATAGTASAGPTLTVGLNSPQGTHTVNGPDAATGGAVTAITAITAAGVDICNIDFTID